MEEGGWDTRPTGTGEEGGRDGRTTELCEEADVGR